MSRIPILAEGESKRLINPIQPLMNAAHAGLNVLQTSFAIMAGGEISLSDGTGNPIFTHGGFRETKEADDEGSKDS